MDYCNVTVIIPALNPDEKLLNVCLELRDNGFDDIIIVNDGSSAETLKFFPDESKYPFCTVLHHRRNRGKGAALRTAFRYFIESRKGKDGVVTIDCAGHHLTNDIIACVKKMTETGKIVLGCRNFSSKKIPLRSRLGNIITRFVFKLFCGIKISDTQTGLRVIPAKYLTDFIEIKGARYEYETNMHLEMKKRHIDCVEVPIDTVGLKDYSATTRYRPFADSLRIYKLILSFVFSSLLSMLVELVVFYLCIKFLFDGVYEVLLATAVARVISSVVNFTINRSKVFDSDSNLARSIFRYIVLAVPLAIASTVSIEGLVWLVKFNAPIAKTLIKCVVDVILFFVSFRIQQNWVFAPKGDKKSADEEEADIPLAALIPSKKRLTAGKVVLRSLSCIGTAIIYIVAAAYTLLFIVANGPSPTLRDTLVLSAMQASATKWVPGLFLSDQEVQQIVDNSYVETKLTIDKESYFENGDNASDDDENIDGMKYIIETHDGFKAYILLVKDPSRLYVGASDETYQAEKGVTVFEIAKRDDAIAAINGGEFEDKNGQGLGNIPIGLTYSNGKCVWDEGGSRTFIGIDNNNRLVVSEGMTKSKADALGIRDGVSFKYGNTLIKSDDDGVHVYYKKRNTGVAQRTAIGQRADGTFILLVTDGRSASSIGANYNDVIDIMVAYGAVTAGMLDGGSSTVMYYEDYYTKYNIDVSTLDEYQQKGLTNRYKAFFSPRRIPTYFCVKR